MVLFTPENVKFFNEHNFNVMISLDGPPEVHDRSRKFAATGMGTFSVIAKNIQMIKEDFPEFLIKFHLILLLIRGIHVTICMKCLITVNCFQIPIFVQP